MNLELVNKTDGISMLGQGHVNSREMALGWSDSSIASFLA